MGLASSNAVWTQGSIGPHNIYLDIDDLDLFAKLKVTKKKKKRVPQKDEKTPINIQNYIKDWSDRWIIVYKKLLTILVKNVFA